MLNVVTNVNLLNTVSTVTIDNDTPYPTSTNPNEDPAYLRVDPLACCNVTNINNEPVDSNNRIVQPTDIYISLHLIFVANRNLKRTTNCHILNTATPTTTSTRTRDELAYLGINLPICCNTTDRNNESDDSNNTLMPPTDNETYFL